VYCLIVLIVRLFRVEGAYALRLREFADIINRILPDGSSHQVCLKLLFGDGEFHFELLKG
jgi:hypothetical protein